MTPEQLTYLTPSEREAWELCQKATPGPWEATYLGVFVKGGCGVAEIAPTYMGYGAPHRDKLYVENQQTAAFIAHARTALPESLRSLAELRAALAAAPHDRNPEDPCNSEQTAWESHMSDTQGVTRDTGRSCDCWKSRLPK